MFCVKCGKEIPDGSAFCNHCGRKQEGTRAQRRRANGFGSVSKLPGRRRLPWTARKDGHYLGYWATKREALEALERLSGQTVRDSYNFTFKDIFDRWKPQHYADLTESGKTQYDRAYAVFEELHGRKWRELRTSDFQRILDLHRDKSVSTVSKYKQLLTQMGDWAVREDVVGTNYASFCEVRGRASVSHKPMTADEVRRIREAACTQEAAKIVCMLIDTGMRIGELFSLPLSDYHEAYVIGGEKTAEGRGRIIPIRQESREHFAYFARQSDGELLIDGYAGNRDVANFRKRDYYPLLDKLKIPRSKTPHSTRTTYATELVSEGLAPAVAQKVLGHADFSTTQKYYNQPDAEALVSAVEAARPKPKKAPDEKKSEAV